MRVADIRGRFFFGETKSERRFGIVFLLVFIGLSVFLRVAGSEWRESADRRMKKAEKRYAKEGRVFEDDTERERMVFKSLEREHFVKSGLYWAALVNLILVALLFFTRPLWCGEVRVRVDETGRAPPGRFFWIALAIALVAGTALRLPRMDLSLYNDEAYNLRHYIHGQFKTDSDGVVKFEAVTWGDTFFKNKANNGVPFSALARLANGDAVAGEVREWRLRLPALIPGLLSIVVVALLAARLFGGLAGVAAAGFLALHPWHLRYCTEARPYGLVLLFAALALWFLSRALRDHEWRDWLGFAISQFMLLWCFAGALYFALGLNVAALFAILRSGGGIRGVARLAVAGVIGAMLYLQVMAPNFPQMAFVLGNVTSFKAPVDGNLVIDLFSYLDTGMPAIDANPDTAGSPALGKIWWPLRVLVLVFLLLFTVFGIALARGSRTAPTLVWGSALALVIALGASAASGAVLHRWYVIYLLPAAAILIGAGLANLWRRPNLRPAAVVGVLCVVAMFIRPLCDYISHPKEDLRAVAAANSAGGAISAAFWSDAGIYDRGMRRVRGLDDLQALMAEARRESRPLRVTFAHRDSALAEMPNCVRLLEDSGEFKKLRDFPGLEEAQFTSHVFEWRGGGGESSEE